MIRKIIKTEKSPLPFGLYSQAIQTGNLLFVSGQLPIEPGKTEIIGDLPEAQLRQCFENIKNICLEANTCLDNAIKINVYYTDFSVSNILDAVMKDFFQAPYPARIRVKVAGLSKNAMVEIDGVFICQN